MVGSLLAMSGHESTERASQPLWTQLLDGMRDPVVVHREGRIMRLNAACAELLGVTADAAVGRNPTDFVHPEDRAYVAGRLRSMTPGARTEPTREHRLVRSDGSSIPVEVYTVPFPHDGQVSFVSFVRDQSERKRLEEELAMADRLVSLGRLAAAVGHEINNPLAYVIGTLDILQHELSQPSGAGLDAPRLLERLGTIRDGTERIQHIVRDLGPLANGDEEARGPVDLNRVLDRSFAMANHEIAGRARVTRRSSGTSLVCGNEIRLVQVFLNLLINAAHSIEPGTPDAHEISVTTSDPGDGFILVVVDDTGTGVPDAIVGRVFEPFFTTKPPGVGTGLGLSISHHIVTSHGGSIAIGRRAERGSSVRVTLPVAPPGPARSPARPRLLVVDDERNLGITLAHMLHELDVVVAQGGNAAVERLRAGSFDAILCDLHMADLSGMALHEHVRAAHPGLERRMIFMTGGALSDQARAFVAARPCLQKPFSADQVMASLATIRGVPDP